MCQSDCRAEALNRLIDVGAEEDVVLAVCEENQGGVVPGSNDRETGVGYQTMQRGRAVAVDRI
jgi:hypothetical protein